MLSEEPIEPGEYITGLLNLTGFFTENSQNAGFNLYTLTQDIKINNSIMGYYFFGYINYVDSIGTMRRTAFCRSIDLVTRRFTPVDDEDHEYSY
jgi:hypothetical protein